MWNQKIISFKFWTGFLKKKKKTEVPYPESSSPSFCSKRENRKQKPFKCTIKKKITNKQKKKKKKLRHFTKKLHLEHQPK